MPSKSKVVSVQFDVIAKRRRTHVKISISRPYRTGKGECACVFALKGIKEEERRTEIFGVDELQALLLSLSWLHHTLKRLRKSGHEFYETGSKERFMIHRYFDALTRTA